MSAYPIVSWGLVLLLGGVAVYIYKPELLKNVLPANNVSVQSIAAAAAVPKQVNKKQKPKKPKAVQEVLDEAINKTQSGSDENKARKRKISAPVGSTVTATTSQGQTKELPRDVENDLDDKAFAQQLAKAQAGTKLQSDSQQKGATSRAAAATLKPKKSEDGLSTAELSSTTGQDADDDLSSVESPEQKPTSSKDISDMLEKPAAGPTTLRLTNVSDEPKKAKQAPRQFEQVQTKKKRNEQAKREEQKRLREESDKIHEQKKQEQLRRARMAEGTSNQTKANTFTSTSNAWKSQSDEKSRTDTSAAPLLDTFEPSSVGSVAPSGVQTASLSRALPSNTVTALKAEVGADVASAMGASVREQGVSRGYTGKVSEEDQSQKLRDDEHDDAWESVTSKKSKKKTRADNDSSSEASFTVSQPVPARAQKPVAKASVPKINGSTQAKEASNRFETIQPVNLGGLQDDEWGA